MVIVFCTSLGITEHFSNETFTIFERNVLIALGWIGLVITEKE